MRRSLAIVLLAVMLLGVFSFVGCGKIEGRYELAKIKGIDGVTAKDYDYWFIQLNEDGSYYMEGEYKGYTTKDRGYYYVDDDGNVTVYDEDHDKVYFLASSEEIVCKNGKLTLTVAYSDGGSAVVTFKRK